MWERDLGIILEFAYADFLYFNKAQLFKSLFSNWIKCLFIDKKRFIFNEENIQLYYVNTKHLTSTLNKQINILPMFSLW